MVKVNEDRVVKEFMELVQIAGHSGEEGEIAKHLKEKLEGLGLKVSIDKAGEKMGGQTGNIIGKLKGTKPGEKIMFSCHMDTVKPGEGIKPQIKDGAIYSDGTTILGADDRAGIAAILEGIKLLKDNNIEHTDVEVVFSIWEEGGLNGAKNLDLDQVEAKYAFVLDSSGSPGEIIIQGPAQDRINVKIKGKSAHAGLYPEKGISAIMIAARAIDNMKLLRIDEETTANIGVINGGEATNIVTAEVSISAEARSINEAKLDKQTKHMAEMFEKAASDFGGVAEVITSREYPSFKISENEDIVVKLKQVFKNIGIEGHTTSTGGGSDTNILNGYGIKAVNLGIGARNPHTFEEHITIEDLVNDAKMVVEIIKEFTN
ncbi:M20/M25/M40 family metallo-hydrolase [Serpentinicella alkaliphila]|uniref:Tripeptide aminopeptidase n=1 Tax=Serpentinicella alkaliphila TaxID=1734049 RepID=A0A4V2T3J8_9FIRM|nr:M20/M25/M40 family metallo-hydrolase [Serpentinicella alkaliphila]QUH25089.1 M20/M25/M40 family metallo-hydrolase [Serpentinicella alkaliphila]TCQ01734.1 tripeptide aminopeptidase [Serpentinicella alkaliphila]